MSTAIAPRGGDAPAVIGDKRTLKDLLENPTVIEQIAEVVPRHLTPERLAKMALIAASRQPKLLRCTRASILQSVMRAAELGLDCSGALGSGYLVPYLNRKIGAHEAQFIPGYRGLIDLARRSGQISTIEAHVVYANDKFDVAFGLHPKLEHTPTLKGTRGEMVCVYAVAKLRDGTTQVEVMTRDEIESIRRRSKAAESGPWVTDFEEMSRKTVVRRLCKYLPLTAELEQALALDAEAEERADVIAEAEIVTVAETGSRADALAERLAGEDPPVVDDPRPTQEEQPTDTPQPTLPATAEQIEECHKVMGDILAARDKDNSKGVRVAQLGRMASKAFGKPFADISETEAEQLLDALHAKLAEEHTTGEGD